MSKYPHPNLLEAVEIDLDGDEILVWIGDPDEWIDGHDNEPDVEMEVHLAVHGWPVRFNDGTILRRRTSIDWF